MISDSHPLDRHYFAQVDLNERTDALVESFVEEIVNDGHCTVHACGYATGIQLASVIERASSAIEKIILATASHKEMPSMGAKIFAAIEATADGMVREAISGSVR